MSEEKNEQKVTDIPPAAVQAPAQKGGGIFRFVGVIVMILLIAAVLMSFLNNQKLHKQVVDLERKVSVLENADSEVGKRILAIEDELVVRSLKVKLKKIAGSLKNLSGLQSLLAENEKVGTAVGTLVDSLVEEKHKLEDEINGKGPRHFQASRPLPPCYQQGCEQTCPQAMVIMHPPLEKPCASIAPPAVHPSPAGHPVPAAHAPAPAAHGGHAAPSDTTAGDQEADSLWTKFIRFRIFGN